MTTVLVVSPHTLERRCYSMLLQKQPDLEVIGEASGGDDVLRKITQLRPDVVLMDIQMPDLEGIEATRHIRHSGSASRVLGIGADDLDGHIYAVLRAGASGFLLKDAYVNELVAAIRVVAVGDNVVSPPLLRQLLDTIPDQFPILGPTQEQRLATLTPRERDVLTAITCGWTNAEIGERLHVAPSTVKSHVSHLLTKIGARDRVQAVIFAYDIGFVRPAA
ncbi:MULTISPECIES: response regulator [unclassified Streptomyces]|uniref:response regulator n=1 Tax=unclassified Streptomyces TaxID=2593676 RepID=UPI0036EA788B